MSQTCVIMSRRFGVGDPDFGKHPEHKAYQFYREIYGSPLLGLVFEDLDGVLSGELALDDYLPSGVTQWLVITHGLPEKYRELLAKHTPNAEIIMSTHHDVPRDE